MREKEGDKMSRVMEKMRKRGRKRVERGRK